VQESGDPDVINLPDLSFMTFLNLDMDRANEKETSSVQRRAIIVTLLKMLTSVPIVANTIWLLLKTVNFT
jgi:hypothetical protein